MRLSVGAMIAAGLAVLPLLAVNTVYLRGQVSMADGSARDIP